MLLEEAKTGWLAGRGCAVYIIHNNDQWPNLKTTEKLRGDGRPDSGTLFLHNVLAVGARRRIETVSIMKGEQKDQDWSLLLHVVKRLRITASLQSANRWIRKNCR